jgi:hypothetical protein
MSGVTVTAAVVAAAARPTPTRHRSASRRPMGSASRAPWSPPVPRQPTRASRCPQVSSMASTAGRWSTTRAEGSPSSTTKVAAFIAPHIPRPFNESLVAYGTMVVRSRGPRAATRGLDAQMPTKHGPGCVRRRCLRWRWRSWVAATATTEVPYQVARDELAVVEAAGKYAVRGGLIGDWTISPFEKIARAPIDRADCASAAGSGPKSASGAGSPHGRAPTRSAGATRASTGGLAMVDTGTGLG